MILSMTGFGRGTAVLNGREITVELRSVNSRYFEYSSRIPRSGQPPEKAAQPADLPRQGRA